MTSRSRFQRLALLAASTTVISAGVLLPGSTFTAAATPHPKPVTMMIADHHGDRHHGSADATQWAETTDPPSGITIRLPGKPVVSQFTKPTDGMTGRLYMVKTDDAVVGFAVFEVPGTRKNLDQGLHGFLDGYNQDSSPSGRLKSTESHEATVDGRHALDAQLRADDGTIGSARFIDDGDHFIQTVTIGTQEKEKPMAAVHQQLLDSLHMPVAGHVPTS
ncbi:hypothetical protein ACWCP6_33480 [Streptomyces sp. NPDC002004]